MSMPAKTDLKMFMFVCLYRGRRKTDGNTLKMKENIFTVDIMSKAICVQKHQKETGTIEMNYSRKATAPALLDNAVINL